MDNTPDFIGKVRVSSVPPNENHDITFYYGEEFTARSWRCPDGPSRDRYTALLVLVMNQGMTVHPTDSEEELDRMMVFLNVERYQQSIRNDQAKSRYGTATRADGELWPRVSPDLPLPELGEDVTMEAPKLSGYALEQLIRAGTTQRLDPKYMVP